MTATEIDPVLARAYLDAKAARDRWQAEVELLKAQVIKALELGPDRYANRGTVNGNAVLAYSTYPSVRLDAKRLRSEHPDIYASYATATIAHRLVATGGVR